MEKRGKSANSRVVSPERFFINLNLVYLPGLWAGESYERLKNI